MDWKYLLTSFDGRISRKPYWIASIALLVVELAGHFVAYRIEGDRLAAIVDLIFTYPEFAVCAKRGHDRNIPTWVVGVFFAIAVLVDMFVVLEWIGESENPSPAFLALLIPWAIFALVLIVDLGFRRGTVGSNRFGPDPLETGAPSDTR